jgi:hypothetical protein
MARSQSDHATYVTGVSIPASLHPDSSKRPMNSSELSSGLKPPSRGTRLSRDAGRARRVGEQRGDGGALTLGHRTDRLVLAHRHAVEKVLAASAAPLSLAGQNLADRHPLDLPSVAEDDLGSGQVPTRNSALDHGPSASHPIGPLECTNMLRTIARHRFHDVSTTPRRGARLWCCRLDPAADPALRKLLFGRIGRSAGHVADVTIVQPAINNLLPGPPRDGSAVEIGRTFRAFSRPVPLLVFESR